MSIDGFPEAEFYLQTGPKTKKVFEKALGRVLFIDEAYRLSEGHFAKESMDEIVGILTQDEFRGKLITILAGYTHEINELLRVNPGLSSRFPEEVLFADLTADQCADILKLALKRMKVRAAALDDPSLALEREDIIEQFEELATLTSWGNARDVNTLAKQMASKAMTGPGGSKVTPDGFITVPQSDVIQCLKAMFRERRARHTGPMKSKPYRTQNLPTQSSAPPSAPPPPASGASGSTSAPPPSVPPPSPPPASPKSTSATSRSPSPQGSASTRTSAAPSTKASGARNRRQRHGRGRGAPPVTPSTPQSPSTASPALPPGRGRGRGRGSSTPPQQSGGPGGGRHARRNQNPAPAAQPAVAIRDPGVDDTVWAQLEKDKRIAEEKERRRQRLMQQLEAEMRALERKKLEEEAMSRALAQKQAENEEAKRRYEEHKKQERLREQERQRKQALYEAEKKKREQQVRDQTKLRNMGLCPAGYQWIPQNGGYRCAGGAHFVSSAQLR